MNFLPPCRALATLFLYSTLTALSTLILAASCLAYSVSLITQLLGYTAPIQPAPADPPENTDRDCARWSRWCGLPKRCHRAAWKAAFNTAVVGLDASMCALMFLCGWIWHLKVVGPLSLTPEATGLSALHVRVKAAELLVGKLPKRCLIVSNHLSNLDGFALKAALYPSRCAALMKSSLVSLPLIGLVIRLTRQPLVYFCDANGGWKTRNKTNTLTECDYALSLDLPLLVYPEGARNSTGCPMEIATFRRGIIKFAIDRELPIVIAAIHGSQRAWPLNSSLIRFSDIYIAISEAIITPKQTDSVQDISDAIRHIMTGLLNDKRMTRESDG